MFEAALGSSSLFAIVNVTNLNLRFVMWIQYFSQNDKNCLVKWNATLPRELEWHDTFSWVSQIISFYIVPTVGRQNLFFIIFSLLWRLKVSTIFTLFLNVNCFTSRYFCTIPFLVQIFYFIFIFAICIFIKITRKIVHSPTENYTYVTKNNQQWNIIHCKCLMCVLTDI